MRLINADTLTPCLVKFASDGCIYKIVFASDVEHAHTIDAEPVRHAKILYNVAIEKEECCGYKKRKGFVLQKYTCSSCYTSIPGESKFCMECGAKLDGGTEK